MIATRRIFMPALAAVLTCGLAACAAFGPCESAACAENAKLSSAVQTKIRAEPNLAVDRIYVQVADQVAYLNGLVDTEVERQQAAKVASAVPGITEVVNKLQLLNGGKM